MHQPKLFLIRFLKFLFKVSISECPTRLDHETPNKSFKERNENDKTKTQKVTTATTTETSRKKMSHIATSNITL